MEAAFSRFLAVGRQFDRYDINYLFHSSTSEAGKGGSVMFPGNKIGMDWWINGDLTINGRKYDNPVANHITPKWDGYDR
ncbi:MAG TPA: hypothetical protein VGN23_00935 [Verrucomicrobiae bacterium]|jgi:hypothetical protein